LRAHVDSEDYLNNLDSKVVNSELALLSNVYNGRIAIMDEDFKVVTDTYGVSYTAAAIQLRRQGLLMKEWQYDQMKMRGV
jgi:hypothetical protein